MQLIHQITGPVAMKQAQGGVPVPTVKDANQTAIGAASDIPQQQWGAASVQQLAHAVDKADPGADPVVKFLAVSQLRKLMAPDEQAQFRMLMQQNRQDLQLGLAQFRAEEAEKRATSAQGAAAQRQQTGIEAANQRQQTGIEAKQQAATDKAATGMESVDAVAKGIANYQQAPLSGWTMKGPWGQAVMAKVYDLNPNYQATQFAARTSGARAFASGRQADTTRSMSVAIDHLAVADDLGKALQNDDVQSMNRVKNALKTEFGYEGPVDFNTAKMIVSDEVTKAVAGGTLSMTERVGLGEQLSAANSPEQLTGVTSTLKRLLGGQLRGLERQYEGATGKGAEDFDKLVSPAAKEQLGGAAGHSGGMPKMGDVFTGKDGKRYRVTGSDPANPDVEEVK